MLSVISFQFQPEGFVWLSITILPMFIYSSENTEEGTIELIRSMERINYVADLNIFR